MKLHHARVGGIDAPVKRGRPLREAGNLGREGVLIGDEGPLAILGLRRADGDMLVAMLDDDTLDHVAGAIAALIEQRNARATPVNDR